MKKAILFLGLFVSGCAHVYITEWNTETSEVTACGNKWASGQDIKEEVQKGCDGDLIAEHGFIRNTGVAWQGNSYGGTAYNTTQGCIQFRCVKSTERIPASGH